MKINESDFDILDRASKMMGTDYNIKWFDAENFDGYIDKDDLIVMIDDLIREIDNLNERIEDIEKDRDEHYQYKEIDPYEEYGLNKGDFY